MIFTDLGKKLAIDAVAATVGAVGGDTLATLSIRSLDWLEAIFAALMVIAFFSAARHNHQAQTTRDRLWFRNGR